MRCDAIVVCVQQWMAGSVLYAEYIMEVCIYVFMTRPTI